ncbi:MAG: leucyl/phenylalanyl-tRNA--protein transferase [Actinobacteria bacterium]|nr:leucyl/phenylalanyl-tRNA--protein transferase [Actinomycetota bacterium]MCZ6738023.1 leucyl/phenylalanyl-tRNA--protein transferase [Actinomycetota bacterium]
MPVEPEASRFDLPDPLDAEGDVVAVGGDLAPGTILQAYRKGMFPMHLPDGHLGWWSPVERTVIPLNGLRITRSLRQSSRRYIVTVDEDFAGVISGCAYPERDESWITAEFTEAYSELNRLGWAHSIEVWDYKRELVGGLYGVAIGGLFAGESMFHRATDASKVALVHLVVVMNEGGGSLLDVQWQTPHLESLGAEVIGRKTYLNDLESALMMPGPFAGPSTGATG